IYARNNERFFAITTSILTRLGLNIVDARILTSKSGYTLDTYLVLDEHNHAITDKNRIAEIHQLLSSGIKNPQQIPDVPPRPIPRQLKHFNAPTRITAEDDSEGRHTLLEIIATDRPGLLARIGRAFLECQVQVRNA